jgi:hypothetical protein
MCASTVRCQQCVGSDDWPHMYHVAVSTNLKPINVLLDSEVEMQCNDRVSLAA